MTSGANFGGREEIVQYKAWPNRIFGNYTLCAIYRDGRNQVRSHGTPRYCIATAEQMNQSLAARTDEIYANPKTP